MSSPNRITHFGERPVPGANDRGTKQRPTAAWGGQPGPAGEAWFLVCQGTAKCAFAPGTGRSRGTTRQGFCLANVPRSQKIVFRVHEGKEVIARPNHLIAVVPRGLLYLAGPVSRFRSGENRPISVRSIPIGCESRRCTEAEDGDRTEPRHPRSENALTTVAPFSQERN